MAYILYSLSAFVIVTATLLFLTRARWRHHVPDFRARVPGATFLYSQLPTSFSDDMEAGLSSNTFDLSGNVEASDSRAGLDDTSKAEVLSIMKKKRMTFDQARKVYLQNRFKANDISPDGRPRDPKFVSFS